MLKDGKKTKRTINIEKDFINIKDNSNKLDLYYYYNQIKFLEMKGISLRLTLYLNFKYRKYDIIADATDINNIFNMIQGTCNMKYQDIINDDY